MEKEINWEERILSCNTALDLLKLEKEAIDKNVSLDNFYCSTWYDQIDILLHRETKFEQVDSLEERLTKLEKQFTKHDHKDKEVVVRIS